MAKSAALLRIKSSFLYLPAFYGILSVFLAFLSLFIDHILLAQGGRDTWIPVILLSDISLSQTILSSIASSLLTMTTITFSTILVVLTTYLSQFSPRALQNFITDHATQRVLGIFTGGFIYCILLLLLLKETEENQLFLVPAFAVGIAILCLIVFVFFIHHVTTWIQVSNLLHNITVKTLDSMEDRLLSKENLHIDSPWDDWESEEISTKKPIIYMSDKAGYIQYIDIPSLVETCSKYECIVKVERKQGDYVNEDTPLIAIYKNEKDVSKKLFMDHISVSLSRAPLEDIEFGIRKVTEIGVRALSTSINDPITAIHCIEQLSTILSRLSSMPEPATYFNDKNRNLRVIVRNPDFFEYLNISFSPLIRYGKSDYDVVTSIFHALTIISNHSVAPRKEAIWRFTQHSLQAMNNENYLEMEKLRLNQILKELLFSMGKSKEFNHIIFQ
ncbi:putative membrane protein [Bacillus tianshenii]|uniref:Membrane protein n=1 Tax=Sutcliffiella tianshenii TaxID=1463404 RepID=A0ABS2P4B1_9BACI|nr:DUF2254 domain-containing protein [Bacillus tianshenii]MBM7621467.1 putative membrane protein [Bacillus tianshenii]